jgi:hypothetical protein
MTDNIRHRAQAFAKFMCSLPAEEIARVNELNRKQAAEQHKQFSAAFKAGNCSFCGDVLTTFDPAKPCRHWLLKPDGLRKGISNSLASSSVGASSKTTCGGSPMKRHSLRT